MSEGVSNLLTECHCGGYNLDMGRETEAVIGEQAFLSLSKCRIVARDQYGWVREFQTFCRTVDGREDNIGTGMRKLSRKRTLLWPVICRAHMAKRYRPIDHNETKADHEML